MQQEKKYKAIVTRETKSGYGNSVETLSIDQLPDNDVLIRVHYSSLNYKDALSASGNKAVTKQYPHTPGIDAAGIVVESRDSNFKKGDKVIVTSFDLGMNTPGGFGQYIRVPAGWILPLPSGLTLRESMILGTAGLTAAIGIEKIIKAGIEPDTGKIVVTGATGGVGSCAVAILSKLNYHVTAITGKKDRYGFLETLGAATIGGRDTVSDESGKPLLGGRWTGAVETVGGRILDTVIRQTVHNGVVTCCGNILGHELHTNVYPFILRGVSLMGIDSGICLMKDRKRVWELLSGKWKPDHFNILAKEVELSEVPNEIKKILNAKQAGRVLINLT